MASDYFDQIVLFDSFDPADRALIRQLFSDLDAPKDTVLFEQGGKADYLYIVCEGEITIEYKPDDAPVLEVGRILPEGVVGWSTALGSETYTSSAICRADCRLLRVRGGDLQDFYHDNPETATLFLNRLAEVVVRRLRNTHSQVVSLLEQSLRIQQDSILHDETLKTRSH